MSLESWHRSTSSKSKPESSRKDRDRRYDDYDRDSYERKRREPSRRQEHDRHSYRKHDNGRDSRRYADKDRRIGRRHKSRSRSRSSSYSSRLKRRHSREKRSSSYDRKTRSISRDRKHIRILRASRSRSKSKTKSPRSANKSTEQNDYFEMFKSDRNSTKIINSLDDDFDKEKIHKEMQERLIQHLAKEGKVYPPPKPQASHPIFANDGSFLETFKKLQEQQHQQQHVEKYEAKLKPTPSQQQQPLFGKRRGGKILKTGIVQKPRIVDDANGEINQNDAWALYLQEVKKYKNVSCDADSKTRPLVK